MTRCIILIAAATAMLSGPAHAHHSRANFDLDNTIELTGTVTKFRYRNPLVGED